MMSSVLSWILLSEPILCVCMFKNVISIFWFAKPSFLELKVYYIFFWCKTLAAICIHAAPCLGSERNREVLALESGVLIFAPASTNCESIWLPTMIQLQLLWSRTSRIGKRLKGLYGDFRLSDKFVGSSSDSPALDRLWVIISVKNIFLISANEPLSSIEFITKELGDQKR